MKKHILFIDPLEKLVIKKDSTILLALAMRELGKEVFLLFEKDFYFSNSESNKSLKVYDFEGSYNKETLYVDEFHLKDSKKYTLDSETIIHMRLDPPFDSRYLRYLWMLKSLEKKFGIQTLNSASGIMLHNEKLYAFEREGSPESYVGTSFADFYTFSEHLKSKGFDELIYKPLDLYQGIGVDKVSLDFSKEELQKVFNSKIKEFKGPVVAQPFLKDVYDGEIRTVFFKGLEMGTILKVPPKGEYLANIAQGASFSKYELNETQKKYCHNICSDLAKHGVDWIAFDLLGDYVSEVNVTCPGLLVEVSHAMEKDLASEIAKLL